MKVKPYIVNASIEMLGRGAEEPLDTADRDAILELENSDGWGLLKLRIHQELARRQAELEQPTDIENTQYTRGVLYALRTVLKIPSILKAEIA